MRDEEALLDAIGESESAGAGSGRRAVLGWVLLMTLLCAVVMWLEI